MTQPDSTAVLADEPDADAPGGRDRAFDIVGLLARLILGGVIFLAGALKVNRLDASANAVVAYQVMPYDLARWVGYLLPFLEVTIGLLLILGLFTRFAALAGTALMVVFIVGIAQAWARGLNIDCGCFGGGGTIAEEDTKYPQEIARDIGLALCGAWLIRRPRTLASLDRILFGH